GPTQDGAHNLDCLVGEARCSAEEWAALGREYRGELQRLDDAVGRLLAATRTALGDRPTYVVFLSDHGEGLDPASGATHHGGTLSREVVTVPMLVTGPDVE